jgi:hypothetical protein
MKIHALTPASWTQQRPERSPWELLAWAVLEQAVSDLALFARYGIITPQGKCLPWPTTMQQITKYGPNRKLGTYWHCVPRTIASSHGPNDHKQLVAWFMSPEAQAYCDLLDCKMPAKDIFTQTIRHHGGLN